MFTFSQENLLTRLNSLHSVKTIFISLHNLLQIFITHMTWGANVIRAKASDEHIAESLTLNDNLIN